MLKITETLAIDEADLVWRAKRAPGPGGQNVNKVASAVELRSATAGLPADVRARLQGVAGRRLGKDGTLVLHARRFRTQERNREDALARLVDLLARAAEAPTPRRPTRPTRASKERRLDSKRRRARLKRTRGTARDE